MTVVEVRHVLWSGLQLEEISETNKLPLACNRLDATRKRVVKIMTHEFNEDKDSNEVKEDKSGSKVESDGNNHSLN